MLIASLILLLVLVFIVLIFMFRKIMDKNVLSATRHLEELDKEYAKKQEEVNRQLEETRQKSQEIIRKAQEEAEKLKKQISDEVEAERDKILQQARTHSDDIMQQAEKSRQALISELEERIAKESIDRACQLIQFTLPDNFKQDVHSHWVKELIEKGFSKLEHLRISKDIQEAKVISAFTLTEEQSKILAEKLKDIFGRHITLKKEVDPKIVAGLIITIGSLVLDGSLRNKIQERAKNA